MKILMLVVLVLSAQTFAQAPLAQIQPGLWKVKMLIVGPDGKAVDPSETIRAALKDLPEEQKKVILEKMSESGFAYQDNDIKVCITDKMAKDPDAILAYDKNNCDSKVISKTLSSMKIIFSCKDGSKGESTWTVKSPTEYEAKISTTTRDGKGKMSYQGNFIKKDCGTVKPPV